MGHAFLQDGPVRSSSTVARTGAWDGQLLHLLDVTARGVLLLTGDSLATRRRGSLFQEGRAEWQYPRGVRGRASWTFPAGVGRGVPCKHKNNRGSIARSD